MKNIILQTETASYRFDISQAFDISLPLRDGKNNLNCYFAEDTLMYVLTLFDV